MSTLPRRAFWASIVMLATVAHPQTDGLSFREIAPAEDQACLIAATNILDHFMRAGRRADPRTGAKLLALYEQYQPRAVYHTEVLYRKRPELFENYLSISKDLYGYELKPSFMGTLIVLEGRVETDAGFADEFSAELVFYENRWRITKIDFE